MRRADKNRRRKICLAAVFCAYCLLMLWLLFGQRAEFPRQGSYADQLSHNYSLIPFHTTVDFIRDLLSRDSEKVREAVINLGGNIGMFLPLGFLLPLVWDKINTAPKCAAVTVCIITAVELAQLFTLLGICDIDDLIFNTVGSLLGYAVLKALRKIRKQRL